MSLNETMATLSTEDAAFIAAAERRSAAFDATVKQVLELPEYQAWVDALKKTIAVGAIEKPAAREAQTAARDKLKQTLRDSGANDSLMHGLMNTLDGLCSTQARDGQIDECYRRR